MTCKNCQTSLETTHNFCGHCGAKVIRNRLTFKNLWQDLSDQFFNLDNRLFRTIIDLFIRPEAVIDGYVTGLRRRYINPFGYLGIALTLSGLLIFITQKFYSNAINFDIYNQGVNPELSRKLMDVVFDYSSLFFIIYIPVFALGGWLVFNKKSYLITEYVIAFCYILGHWSIVMFPMGLLLVVAVPEYYMAAAFPQLLLMVAYIFYALQRLQRYRPWRLILHYLALGIMFFIGYSGLIILLYVVLFATGTISLEDFRPPE